MDDVSVKNLKQAKHTVNKVDTTDAIITDDVEEIIKKFLLQKAVWTGKDVSKWINQSDLHSYQIQPNGVDLTVDRIFVQRGNVILGRNEHVTNEGTLIEIEPIPVAGLKNTGWFLNAGYYTIQWAEGIQIPLSAIGLLSPRSTLLRTCATIYGAVWDRGYHGIGQSGLQIFDSMLIERFTRLAQVIFIEAMTDQSSYKVIYQGENIAKEKTKKNRTD